MNQPRNVFFPPRGTTMAGSDVEICICSDEPHLLWFGHKPFLIDCVCLGTENLKIVSGENISGMWHMF